MRLDDRPRMEAAGAGVVVELEAQVRRTRLPLNTGAEAPVIVGAEGGVKLNSRNDIEQMPGSVLPGDPERVPESLEAVRLE